MKLIQGKDFKNWDEYTIQNEPIKSIDLMERASEIFTECLIARLIHKAQKFDIICGEGNNGGDGLAIARMLRDAFFDVNVHILKFGQTPSADYKTNLKRLEKLGDIPVQHYSEKMPEISKKSRIIDAILGTGLNQPVGGILEKWINYINLLPNNIISVDIPSGMPADGVCMGTAVKSNWVITFQRPKLSFFYRENYKFCKRFDIIDIGLSTAFIKNMETAKHLITSSMIRKIHKTRLKHSHKGDYGHALIVAGSEGKIGAAILSTQACLRAGAGLVTTCVPECGREIIHETIPEAMVISKGYSCFNGSISDVSNFTIGVGPGLGTHEKTVHSLAELFRQAATPMVIDADGLNVLSEHRDYLNNIPEGSILTPHYKEFQRLFGEVHTEVEMFEKAEQAAEKFKCILILKGAYTRIITPERNHFINTTGNPGMATAGSGDVLTGILTGLLAQGYLPEEAAIIGVYIHGLAGNLAIRNESYETLIAGDIIKHMGKAFHKSIYRKSR